MFYSIATAVTSILNEYAWPNYKLVISKSKDYMPLLAVIFPKYSGKYLSLSLGLNSCDFTLHFRLFEVKSLNYTFIKFLD